MQMPSMELLGFIYTVIMGLVVGSFLNVVIARLPSRQSVVRPRSRCPVCETPIAWYDNIPVLSYLALRGRCRRCRTSIPLRYPLVELLTGCLWGAFFIRFGVSFPLFLWLPLSAALVCITFLDIDHFWVPDVITYPSMIFVLVCVLMPQGPPLVVALLGLLPALFLWLIAWSFQRLTGREGLGFGDVKLLALLGLALGPWGALMTTLAGSVQGALIGSLVNLFGGHQQSKAAAPDGDDDDWVPPPNAIPFGPFLILGAFEVALFPDFFAQLPSRLIDLMAKVSA